MIAIASVRHTGTRFLSRLLGEPLRVHFGEKYLYKVKDYKIVTPLRELDKVITSWERRQLELKDLHVALGVMTNYPTDFYIPVDSADRETYLAKLSDYLGEDIVTDWAPVTDGHGSDSKGNPEYKDLILKEYSDWFKQFYG